MPYKQLKQLWQKLLMGMRYGNGCAYTIPHIFKQGEFCVPQQHFLDLAPIGHGMSFFNQPKTFWGALIAYESAFKSKLTMNWYHHQHKKKTPCPSRARP